MCMGKGASVCLRPPVSQDRAWAGARGVPGASFPAADLALELQSDSLFEPRLPPCCEGLFVSVSPQQLEEGLSTTREDDGRFLRPGSASVPDCPDAPRHWDLSQPSPEGTEAEEWMVGTRLSTYGYPAAASGKQLRTAASTPF